MADLELSCKELSSGPKETLATRGPGTYWTRTDCEAKREAGLGWVWSKGLESRIQLRFWNQEIQLRTNAGTLDLPWEEDALSIKAGCIKLTPV